MTNEITVLKSEDYGLEKKEGLNIENAFLPKIEERNLLAVMYGELIKKDITDETVKEAGDLRKKLVKVRTGISDIHKVQKSFFLAAGKFCDAKKNKETLPVVQMEEGARKIENTREIIKEQERQKIRDERTLILEKYDTNPGVGDLAMMSPDVWKHYIKSVEAEYNERIENEKKAEEERIESERIEKLRWKRADAIKPYYDFFEEEKGLHLGNITEDKFKSLLNKLKKDKSDYESEQEKIRIENEKLKKEAELKRFADEKAEKERKRLAKIESDKRAKIEKDRLAKQEEERKAHEAILQKERDEKLKIQKELEAKQEEERKVKQAETLRLKNEADEKRKLELATDKVKLQKWVSDMTILQLPDGGMSKGSIQIRNDIHVKFDAFKNWAISEIKKIK